MPRTPKPKQKKKRSYGIGRKYQRGETWWVAVYDGSGKEIRQSTHSTKETDADELLGKLLRERSRGELVSIDANDHSNIAGVLDDYIERRSGKRAAKTIATYRGQADSHLKPYFGLMPPAKLTTDMLTDYREFRTKQNPTHFHSGAEGNVADIKGRKITQTTINRELGLLRSALRDLNKRRPNLMRKIPYFPMESERDNVRQGFLSESDFINKLYPELPRHLRALAACAFYCGGRKSEWLRLDWAEVDWDHMTIHFAKTKNKRPREVPIVPNTLMVDALLEALALKNAAWPDEPAVFVYDGKRMASVGDAWDKACARAGFPDVLFHDMRRSASRNMRNRGIGQEVRMKIIGHLTTSMDTRYGIVDKGDLDQAREKLAGTPRKGPATDAGNMQLVKRGN